MAIACSPVVIELPNGVFTVSYTHLDVYKRQVYAQGMSLLRAAAETYGWGLEYAAIVRVWRAGCIIRADLLNEIAAAFERQPALSHLLLDDAFVRLLSDTQAGWRAVVKTGAELGIPLLAVAAALGYFDALRSDRLPANLIQAQRDYFGAHTYHLSLIHI